MCRLTFSIKRSNASSLFLSRLHFHNRCSCNSQNAVCSQIRMVDYKFSRWKRIYKSKCLKFLTKSDLLILILPVVLWLTVSTHWSWSMNDVAFDSFHYFWHKTLKLLFLTQNVNLQKWISSWDEHVQHFCSCLKYNWAVASEVTGHRSCVACCKIWSQFMHHERGTGTMTNLILQTCAHTLVIIKQDVGHPCSDELERLASSHQLGKHSRNMTHKMWSAHSHSSPSEIVPANGGICCILKAKLLVQLAVITLNVNVERELLCSAKPLVCL